MKMIPVFEKVQPKSISKNKRELPKDGFDFKNTLNQAVSENQNSENKLNNTSTKKESLSEAKETESQEGVASKEKINEEKTSSDKDSIDRLALQMNGFQIEIKQETTPVKIEAENILNLKNSVNNDGSNTEIGKLQSMELSKSTMLEKQEEGLPANLISNEMNKDTGKIKLQNMEKEEGQMSEIDKVKATENAPILAKEDTLKTGVEDNSLNQEAEFSLLQSQSKVVTTEPEVITVKVGDGQTISSEKLVTEVAKNVVIKTDGNNEYELQLDPENLGKIKVKLLFEDGKLTVSLMCNNSKTANLLSEGISSLGQVIQQSTKSEVTVNVRDENYLNDNQQQQSKQNGQNQEQRNKQNKDETEFVDNMKLGLWEIENLKKQFSTDFKIM